MAPNTTRETTYLKAIPWNGIDLLVSRGAPCRRAVFPRALPVGLDSAAGGTGSGEYFFLSLAKWERNRALVARKPERGRGSCNFAENRAVEGPEDRFEGEK